MALFISARCVVLDFSGRHRSLTMSNCLIQDCVGTFGLNSSRLLAMIGLGVLHPPETIVLGMEASLASACERL